MDKLTFKLEQFEGPLDLLLFLIAKHKLNIYEIEIAKLLEQYLEYIDEAQFRSMELASEFLEMASRLVYMKTLSLLPRHDEEQEKLREELTGQLLEYRACKLVAQALRRKNLDCDYFVRTPAVLEARLAYTLCHSSNDLIVAYTQAMGKAQKRMPPPVAAFSGIVKHRIVSVTSKIIFVLKRLYKQRRVHFNSLFETDDRSELVATFLAVLELVKSKRIEVSDDNSEITFKKH
ncbi:MAG: segregation/condensation protein A [Hydrogenoanaerobacterium sp.]